MCIIVYKPAGKDMPSKETLLKCFAGNPDGAGLMYTIPRKHKVRVRKGFMTFDDLLDGIDAIPNVKDVPVVLHFRIGTQGLNDARMTHPFPISTEQKVLCARDSFVDIALTHNGIIPLTSSWSSYPKSATKEEFSDTFYFVRDYASDIIGGRIDYHADGCASRVLEKLAESKLCILGADGHVEMLGDFIEDDGIFYSNNAYKTGGYYKPKHYTSSASSLPSYAHGGGSWVDWDSYYDEKYNDEMGKGSEDKGNEGELIRGVFLPDSYYLTKEDVCIPTCEGLFVMDFDKNIYQYDDAENGCMPMTGFQCVDDTLEEYQPDAALAMMFRLV